MPYKDLHSSPFSISTVTKLEIFEDYAEAWLPTFIMQSGIDEIHIFDFFGGPGYDQIGSMGSPIRLLHKINRFSSHILTTRTSVTLHVNEFEPNKIKQRKYELLQKNVQEYLEQNTQLGQLLDVKLYNEDAAALFFQLLPQMQAYPSLVYLDQNGVKFISQQFITELEKLKTVDFLYFVSSSYFWRLGQTEEFQRVLPIDMNLLKREKYTDIHRIISSALKQTLPKGTQLKLFPFSIKKDPNIYGIIFGSKHYRAVAKFLDIAWKRNERNGEADFDIDGEVVTEPIQMDLFAGPYIPKLTKVDVFKEEIKRLALSGNLRDNKQALNLTFEAGHLPKHAADALKELKKLGRISFEGSSPAVTYESVYKEQKLVKYIVNGSVKH